MAAVLWIAVSCIVPIFSSFWLMMQPFRTRLRCPLWLCCSIIALSSGLVSLVVALGFQLFGAPALYTEWTTWFGASLIGIFLLLCFTFINAHPRQLAFMLLIVKCYIDDLDVLTKLLKTFLFQENGIWPISNAPFGMGYALLLTALFALTLPLLHLFMSRLVRPLIEQASALPFWRHLWLIPLTFATIFQLGICPLMFNQDSVSFSLDIVLVVIWSFGTFLTFYVIVRMLSATAQSVQWQEKLHISQLQLNMQKEQYHLLQKNIETTRQARHDLRHHFLALEGLVLKKDYAGILQYLHRSQEDIIAQDIPQVCDNYAVDAIVRYHMRNAQQNGIDVQASVTLPFTLGGVESDLCIVIGNLVENAVEACLRQKGAARFIKINAGMTSPKMIAVSIKNSYSGEIHLAGNAFCSAKHMGDGIGTASVRSIAERNGGFARFSHADGIFEASVLLRMNEEPAAAPSARR